MHALVLLLFAAIPPDAPPVMPPDAPPVSIPDATGEPTVTVLPCQCGETCDCVDCQCPDCPHRGVIGLSEIGNTPIPPLEITVADQGCPPCERFKRDALPRLVAAGWIEGRHYQLRVVPFGSTTVPAFSYGGQSWTGYGGWSSWRSSLTSAMSGQGAGSAPVASPVVHDARAELAPGHHSHRCDACGTVWNHDGSGEHYSEHSCPNCGRYENEIWQGQPAMQTRGTYYAPAVRQRGFFGRLLRGGCANGNCGR